jgi:hypothetical protein
VIVKDMGQPLTVVGTDRKYLRAKVMGTDVGDLYLAAKESSAIQFNRQLKRVAILYEQAALDPHSGLAGIYHLAGRGKRPTMQSAWLAHLDPRCLPFETHRLVSFDGNDSSSLWDGKAHSQCLPVLKNPTIHLIVPDEDQGSQIRRLMS